MFAVFIILDSALGAVHIWTQYFMAGISNFFAFVRQNTRTCLGYRKFPQAGSNLHFDFPTSWHFAVQGLPIIWMGLFDEHCQAMIKVLAMISSCPD